MKRTKSFGEKEYRIYADFVKNMPLVWDYFKLMGGNYRLIPCEKRGEDSACEESASYYPASNRDGWDIYYWDGLDEWIARPIIFHEVVELYHRELGMGKTPAHNATMLWEKRFCIDNLSSSQLERLLEFKQEIGYNGFDLSPNS